MRVRVVASRVQGEEWVVVACGYWGRGAAACVAEDGSCSCAAASCSCWDSCPCSCSCCSFRYSFPCSCSYYSWEDVGCGRRSRPAAAAGAVESLAAADADSSRGSFVGSVAAAGVAVDAVGPLRLRDVSCGPWCDDDDAVVNGDVGVNPISVVKL